MQIFATSWCCCNLEMCSVYTVSVMYNIYDIKVLWAFNLIISSLLFYDDVTVCSRFITIVKVRPFCWWCCVCCIVLLTLCIHYFTSCHDHNKTAPCIPHGIKVFWIELNLVTASKAMLNKLSMLHTNLSITFEPEHTRAFWETQLSVSTLTSLSPIW